MHYTSSERDTEDVTCNNCEALKIKVIQLQTKISWFKKSKVEKLQTRRQEDTQSEDEAVSPLAGRHGDSDSDMEPNDEETSHQKGDVDWSTHEEDSQSTTDKDPGNEESSPLQYVMLILNTVCNVTMFCTKPKKYIGIYVIFLFTF